MRAIALGGATAAVVLAVAGAPRPRRRPGGPEPTAAPVRLGPRLEGWAERAVPGRRRARRDAQLPDALDRLAAALRAGQAIGPAIEAVAPALPEPLRADLAPVAAALAHGAPVATALAGWGRQADASADVRLVAAALTLGADSGGEVARAVDRIASTLRERAELAGEVRSLATQARASAAVLALAPPAFAGLVATIEPGAVAFLLTTPVGLACLGAGVGLEALGATWMARITRRAS